MIKFTINTQHFLKILQKITPLLNKNDTSSILQNICIDLNNKRLLLMASNRETEILIKTNVHHYCCSGKTTVSGKKILDICKGLINTSTIQIEQKKSNLLHITTNTSYFKLLTLSHINYPKFHSLINEITFNISQNQLKDIIKKTHFCMANNDIRHYLNGLLLEFNNTYLKSITTDGHRMAISSILLTNNTYTGSIILSRKSIIDINKLLDKTSETIIISIDKNNFRIRTKDLIFTTKLIDGSFPNYKNLIIKTFKIILKIDSIQLKSALQRVAILSDKKFKAVQFHAKNSLLTLTSNNEEDELAKEIIPITTQDEEIIFSVNLSYVIDVLNVITNNFVYILLNIPIYTIQIQENLTSNDHYIIMPLRF